MNQMLSITHEIIKSFDDGFEVRSVLYIYIYIYIYKAFDDVCIKGLFSS